MKQLLQKGQHHTLVQSDSAIRLNLSTGSNTGQSGNVDQLALKFDEAATLSEMIAVQGENTEANFGSADPEDPLLSLDTNSIPV